jgi:hypothetical protein
MTKQVTKVQITKAQLASLQKEEEKFLSDFGELFAYVLHADLLEDVNAFLVLNYTTEERQAAPLTPGAFRKMLALAVITLFNRGALVPLCPLGELAEKDLAKLLKETAIDLELIAAPTPPPPTEAQLLEQEVRSDWRTLSMDKIRQKKNASRKYSATLERLANNHTLESSVTSLRQAQ